MSFKNYLKTAKKNLSTSFKKDQPKKINFKSSKKLQKSKIKHIKKNQPQQQPVFTKINITRKEPLLFFQKKKDEVKEITTYLKNSKTEIPEEIFSEEEKEFLNMIDKEKENLIDFFYHLLIENINQCEKFVIEENKRIIELDKILKYFKMNVKKIGNINTKKLQKINYMEKKLN
jgi:hypothetical protein